MNRSRAWSVYARLRLSLAALAGAENGIALPIVLAVLVMGTLIVTPFLTHAGTNLIGARAYAQISHERLAAEAGIEQALWDLKYGTLDSRLDGSGGTLSYTLDDRINGYSPTVTVARSGSSGGGGAPGGESAPAGTITKPYSDRYQFDSAVYTPVAVNSGGDIYVIAYRNTSNDIILKTVGITAAGDITPSTISTRTVDTTGYEPDIIQIASGIVALVYRGASSKGYIATYAIAGNGVIGVNPINRLVFNNSGGTEPRIINLSGEFYALVYRGPSNKGYVQTVQISADGTIINAFISSFNFAPTCYTPSIIRVSGSHYAAAYRGATNRGYLTTLNINDLGVITNSVISNAIFSTTAYTPEVIMTSPGIAGVVYRGASNRGYAVTLSIDGSGIISLPVSDTFIFDNSAGYEPYWRNISGTVFVVFYRGSGNDGYIKTLEIAADGVINNTVIDSYIFDSSSGYEPYLVYLSGSLYAAVYRGGPTPGTNGYVLTVEIATETTATTLTYNIQAAAGTTVVTVELTKNSGLTRITSWNASR